METPTVADLIDIMEMIAPRRLAEDWDNSGLQVGHLSWPVGKVWVALDPLPEIVNSAVDEGVDMLITHHPLLFKPLRSIDTGSPIGAVVERALTGRLAIFAAHTNLDSSLGGVNDTLCEKIGLGKLEPLNPAEASERFKLVVYVPVGHEEKILDALRQAEAGRIGDYGDCSFRMVGQGTFRPGAGTRPFIGQPGEISHVDETRIETWVERSQLPGVVEQIRQAHPYEQMAWDLFPTVDIEAREGIGRVGTLAAPICLEDLARRVKEKLRLGSVRYAGNPSLIVERVAVCSGSGSSLLNSFLASGTQAYISGDLKYHDARIAESAGVGLIDIGHFGSEHPVLSTLTDRLEAALAERGMAAAVSPCLLETDPFHGV